MNIGSVMSSIIPQAVQLTQTVMIMQNPEMALLFGGMSGQDMSLAGSPFNTDMFNPLNAVMSLVTNILKGLPSDFGSVRSMRNQDGDESTVEQKHGKRLKRDNHQKKIQNILNSNLSVEEKIILISGIVTSSINDQLDGLLKEEGKMADKMNKTGSQGGGNIQNVENKIQLLMQRLNRMQTMTSNMLQAMHTTKKSMVMNIRV